MMILPRRLRWVKRPRSASVAFMVCSVLRSVNPMSLSKSKPAQSQTPGGGISSTMRPKKALPKKAWIDAPATGGPAIHARPLAGSGEHTAELQSQANLACRLLLVKKKIVEIGTDPAT